MPKKQASLLAVICANLVAIGAVPAALVFADSTDPSGERAGTQPARQPADTSRTTAGAADYLHFGRTGLCVIGDGFDWGTTPEGSITIDDDVIYVDPDNDNEAYLEVIEDDQGTQSAWDDQLVLRLWSFDGADEAVEFSTPKWSVGGIGGYTTVNEPSTLAVRRIEYRGPSAEHNAIDNSTRVPMHAVGWFANVEGHNGFQGGDGPDCVEGSPQNDVIFGRGGDDAARGVLGDDSLDGGPGNDTLDGSSGDDKLRGRDGVDHLKGSGGSDCYSDATDGKRDLLDDPDGDLVADLNEYVAEPGIVNGVEVPTIDVITEAFPFFVVDCI